MYYHWQTNQQYHGQKGRFWGKLVQKMVDHSKESLDMTRCSKEFKQEGNWLCKRFRVPTDLELVRKILEVNYQWVV